MLEESLFNNIGTILLTENYPFECSQQDIVLGGTDFATMVEWAMAEIMEQSREDELSGIVGMRKVPPKLKYLDAVLNESL